MNFYVYKTDQSGYNLIIFLILFLRIQKGYINDITFVTEIQVTTESLSHNEMKDFLR